MAGTKNDSREQIQRIFAIIKVLLKRRTPITAVEIQKFLELEHDIVVGLRTVQRDIALIKSLGYEIESSQFRGYALQRTELSDLLFSDSEVQALRLGSSLFNYFEGTEIKEQIDRAVQLVIGKNSHSSLMKEYESRLDSPFMVHLGPKRNLAQKNGVVDDLFTAIQGNTQVIIEYHRPTMNTVPLTVEPYKIILYRDSLYLLAHRPDHEELQIFHVSRISSVEHTETGFTKENSLLEQFEEKLSYSMGILVSGEITDVEIHFDPAVSDALHEREWHHSQIIEKRDDSVVLKMRILMNEEFESWVRSWGEMVFDYVCTKFI